MRSSVAVVVFAPELNVDAVPVFVVDTSSGEAAWLLSSTAVRTMNPPEEMLGVYVIVWLAPPVIFAQ